MFETLSLEELYALVLRKKGSMAKELATRYTTPRTLFQTTIQELQEIEGIGETRAKQILALVELSKRMLNTNGNNKVTLSSPKGVADLLAPEMQFLDREHFKVVLLNTKNKVITIETVSIGSLNSTIVHPREIYKNPIKNSAAAIIAVHNHPSGDPTPSSEDIETTKRLKEVGKLLGIELLDHVIIGDGDYYSFKENGLIF